MSPSPFSPPSSSANGFAMLSVPASPREAHFMYDELHSVLSPQDDARARRRRSSAEVKEGLKKLFRGL
ncbi:uncharacterized protein PHACADRAFT_250522 [Phanerochaete carnosa HHB-10118-sp]|uniref:Uncharacterized protein n=1 Tax=Phanerochaete carnosa (strain HHB-10118-sp) TaxID=650164 RepID=K5VAB6_PHACS|nr:uncharacterized protein PHACADRAFT_250522 [Phanerochaete carnosa HHB-10118-sp]EKM59791.1 hypothetical protein PHACADRAFT_250522 [Phanerochaete carnosa HHB-10118-sp]